MMELVVACIASCLAEGHPADHHDGGGRLLEELQFLVVGLELIWIQSRAEKVDYIAVNAERSMAYVGLQQGPVISVPCSV